MQKKAKLATEYNPLDATPIHPESYEIAKQLRISPFVDILLKKLESFIVFFLKLIHS